MAHTPFLPTFRRHGEIAQLIVDGMKKDMPAITWRVPEAQNDTELWYFDICGEVEINRERKFIRFRLDFEVYSRAPWPDLADMLHWEVTRILVRVLAEWSKQPTT